MNVKPQKINQPWGVKFIKFDFTDAYVSISKIHSIFQWNKEIFILEGNTFTTSRIPVENFESFLRRSWNVLF